MFRALIKTSAPSVAVVAVLAADGDQVLGGDAVPLAHLRERSARTASTPRTTFPRATSAVRLPDVRQRCRIAEHVQRLLGGGGLGRAVVPGTWHLHVEDCAGVCTNVCRTRHRRRDPPMTVHREIAFEDAIERAMRETGWRQGQPANYRRELGLDTAMLMEFFGATQVEQWNRLVAYSGGDPDTAQRAFAERLAKEIDERGAVDVLRHGVKDRGRARSGSPTSARRTRSPTDAARPVRGEPADRHPAAALLEPRSRPLPGPGAVRQRHPGRHRRVEEPADRPDRRARQGAVPARPRPRRAALRPPRAGPFRGRPGAGLHHDATRRARRPGSCRSTPGRTARGSTAARATRRPATPATGRRTCGSRSGSPTPGSTCSSGSCTSRAPTATGAGSPCTTSR